MCWYLMLSGVLAPLAWDDNESVSRAESRMSKIVRVSQVIIKHYESASSRSWEKENDFKFPSRILSFNIKKLKLGALFNIFWSNIDCLRKRTFYLCLSIYLCLLHCHCTKNDSRSTSLQFMMFLYKKTQFFIVL